MGNQMFSRVGPIPVLYFDACNSFAPFSQLSHVDGKKFVVHVVPLLVGLSLALIGTVTTDTFLCFLFVQTFLDYS